MYLSHAFIVYTAVTAWHAHVVQSERSFYKIDDAETLFDGFIKTYNKNYRNDEYKTRFNNFVNTLKDINERNERDSSAHDINEFADLSWKEFSAKFTGVTIDTSYNATFGKVEHFDAPEALDYRTQGVVNPVKNQQETCGSCWAFSAVATLESRYALKHKTLYDLSEQQLLDCTQGKDCTSGGDPVQAFNQIIASGGIEKSQDYPYVATKQQCAFDKSKAVVTAISADGGGAISEDDMKSIVARDGPISVVMRIWPEMGTMKGSAVADPDPSSCQGQTQHAVTIVGYGTDNGMDYWLIRNSWGAGWGDAGYFKLIRGKAVCEINAFVRTVQV